MAEPHAGRPEFAPGYGVDPSQQGNLLPWNAVHERLTAARNYWVSTTRPDGRPHATPVWGLWLDDTLYFSTDTASRKGRNLAANPEVAVHLESGDDVVILEGIATRVTTPPTLDRFVDLYDAKYGIRPDPSNPSQAVFAVHPRVAFAWTEQDFPSTTTRWQFST